MGLVHINVFDESRGPGESRVFHCESDVLLSKMRYFRSYLKNQIQPGQEVDISVHCDYLIFEWLLNWAKSTYEPQVACPQLSLELVLPVLISSNFLQMEELVEESLVYLADRIMDLCNSKCDVTGLPNPLFSQFSKTIPLEQLELMVSLHDEALNPGCLLGQVVNKVYKYKLETLLKETRTTVVRCSVCGCLYSSTDRGKLVCATRQQQLAVQRGQDPLQRGLFPAVEHVGHDVDPTWRFQEYLSTLRVQQAPWRDIFWGAWSLVHVLYCHHCLAYFPAAELSKCSFHPEPPLFMSGHSNGRHPCCGGQATRSGSIQHYRGGCCPREHQVVPSQLKGRSMNSHLVSQCLPPSMLAVYHTLLDFKHLVVPEEEIATIARHAELVGGDMSSGSGSSPISSSGADEEESAHAYERDRQRKSRFKTVLRGSQEGLSSVARQQAELDASSRSLRLSSLRQPPNSSPEKSRPLLPSIPAIQAIQASYSTSALHPTGDVHDASIPHTVASPRDSPLLTSPRAVTNPLLGSSAGASSAQRQLLQSMSYPNLPSGASSRSASQSAGWTEVAAAAGGDERVAAALGTSLAALQLRGGEAASSSFPSAPRGVPPLPGRPPLSSSENSVSSSASQPMQGSDAGAGAGERPSASRGQQLTGVGNKSGSKNGSGSGAASMAGYGLEWGAARDCRSSTLSGTKSVDMSGISLSAAAQAAQYAAAAAQTRFNSANSSSAAPSSAADTIPRSDAELTKGMERSNPMSGLMPEGANHYSMDLDSRHSASGSGGGGRGSSASGAAKTGGSSAPARKLKLELLHEDDMARMGSLIKHLTSCRPPRRVPSSKASAPRAASTNPASSKPAASGSAHSSSSSRSSRPATAQDKENKGVRASVSRVGGVPSSGYRYASPVAGHQEYGLSSSLPGGAAMQARSMSAQHSGSISNSRAGVYR